MSRYKGKLAIVTGSAVGIGAGIVERLLKGGLTVKKKQQNYQLPNKCLFCFTGTRLGYKR